MEILLLPLFLIYPIKWFFPELLMIAAFLFVVFKIKPWQWKVPMMLLAPIAIFLIFRGDTYIKNARWDEFCNSRDDYFKVHETVLLGREYWDDDGWPIFHRKRNKAFLPEVFNDRYEVGMTYRNVEHNFIGGSTLRFIKDKSSDEYLLTMETYSRAFGWWRQLISEKNYNPARCGALGIKANLIPGSKYNGQLTSWVFLPKETLE